MSAGTIKETPLVASPTTALQPKGASLEGSGSPVKLQNIRLYVGLSARKLQSELSGIKKIDQLQLGHDKDPQLKQNFQFAKNDARQELQVPRPIPTHEHNVTTRSSRAGNQAEGFLDRMQRQAADPNGGIYYQSLPRGHHISPSPRHYERHQIKLHDRLVTATQRDATKLSPGGAGVSSSLDRDVTPKRVGSRHTHSNEESKSVMRATIHHQKGVSSFIQHPIAPEPTLEGSRPSLPLRLCLSPSQQQFSLPQILVQSDQLRKTNAKLQSQLESKNVLLAKRGRYCEPKLKARKGSPRVRNEFQEEKITRIKIRNVEKLIGAQIETELQEEFERQRILETNNGLSDKQVLANVMLNHVRRVKAVLADFKAQGRMSEISTVEGITRMLGFDSKSLDKPIMSDDFNQSSLAVSPRATEFDVREPPLRSPISEKMSVPNEHVKIKLTKPRVAPLNLQSLNQDSNSNEEDESPANQISPDQRQRFDDELSPGSNTVPSATTDRPREQQPPLQSNEYKIDSFLKNEMILRAVGNSTVPEEYPLGVDNCRSLHSIASPNADRNEGSHLSNYMPPMKRRIESRQMTKEASREKVLGDDDAVGPNAFSFANLPMAKEHNSSSKQDLLQYVLGKPQTPQKSLTKSNSKRAMSIEQNLKRLSSKKRFESFSRQRRTSVLSPLQIPLRQQHVYQTSEAERMRRQQQLCIDNTAAAQAAAMMNQAMFNASVFSPSHQIYNNNESLRTTIDEEQSLGPLHDPNHVVQLMVYPNQGIIPEHDILPQQVSVGAQVLVGPSRSTIHEVGTATVSDAARLTNIGEAAITKETANESFFPPIQNNRVVQAQHVHLATVRHLSATRQNSHSKENTGFSTHYNQRILSNKQLVYGAENVILPQGASNILAMISQKAANQGQKPNQQENADISMKGSGTGQIPSVEQKSNHMSDSTRFLKESIIEAARKTMESIAVRQPVTGPSSSKTKTVISKKQVSPRLMEQKQKSIQSQSHVLEEDEEFEPSGVGAHLSRNAVENDLENSSQNFLQHVQRMSARQSIDEAQHKSVCAQGASLRSTDMSQIHYNQWQLTQMKLLLEQHHQQKFLPPLRNASPQAAMAQPFYGAAGGGGGIIIRRKRSLGQIKKQSSSTRMGVPVPVRSPTVTRSPADLHMNYDTGTTSPAIASHLYRPQVEPLALSGDAIGKQRYKLDTTALEHLQRLNAAALNDESRQKKAFPARKNVQERLRTQRHSEQVKAAYKRASVTMSPQMEEPGTPNMVDDLRMAAEQMSTDQFVRWSNELFTQQMQTMPYDARNQQQQAVQDEHYMQIVPHSVDSIVRVPQNYEGMMRPMAHDIQTQKMTPGNAVSPMSPKAFDNIRPGKHETPQQSKTGKPDVVIQEYASMKASREPSRQEQKRVTRLEAGKKYSTRDFNATDTAIITQEGNSKEEVHAGGGEKLKTEIKFQVDRSHPPINVDKFQSSIAGMTSERVEPPVKTGGMVTRTTFAMKNSESAESNDHTNREKAVKTVFQVRGHSSIHLNEKQITPRTKGARSNMQESNIERKNFQINSQSSNGKAHTPLSAAFEQPSATFHIKRDNEDAAANQQANLADKFSQMTGEEGIQVNRPAALNGECSEADPSFECSPPENKEASKNVAARTTLNGIAEVMKKKEEDLDKQETALVQNGPVQTMENSAVSAYRDLQRAGKDEKTIDEFDDEVQERVSITRNIYNMTGAVHRSYVSSYMAIAAATNGLSQASSHQITVTSRPSKKQVINGDIVESLQRTIAKFPALNNTNSPDELSSREKDDQHDVAPVSVKTFYGDAFPKLLDQEVGDIDRPKMAALQSKVYHNTQLDFIGAEGRKRFTEAILGMRQVNKMKHQT